MSKWLWAVFVGVYPLLACAESVHVFLEPCQYLKTTGARDVTPFQLDGATYVAVPQLAKDAPGEPVGMNSGDADVDVVVFKWEHGELREYQRIPGHGNEDTEFFRMGDRAFLAVASIESGPRAPYNFHTYSTLYEWDGRRFFPVQQFLSFAAKNWKAFSIGARHFLALANGVLPPDGKAQGDTNSTLYEWNGSRFEPLQTFPTKWGIGWEFFTMDGAHFLGLTDHAQASSVYRWGGEKFVPFQSFPETGGRAFEYFEIDDGRYLAYANLLNETVVLKWDGERFAAWQRLEGLGGRNFAFFAVGGERYLFLVNYITGSRSKPETALMSTLYRWQDNRFQPVQEVETHGGVNASVFVVDGREYLAVANSLDEEAGFSVDSVIYRIKGD